MTEFENKVVLITGAARGQGRNHAIRFAEAGADIIAYDACVQVDSLGYDLATADDLAETVRQVEATGRRIVWGQVDVRDFDALQAFVDGAVAELGRLDVVIADRRQPDQRRHADAVQRRDLSIVPAGCRRAHARNGRAADEWDASDEYPVR